MMSHVDPHSSAQPARSSRTTDDDAAHSDWDQLEKFVVQLQDLAHTATDADQFYRELLDGCVTLLAAAGGVVWEPAPNGRWQARQQAGDEQTLGEVIAAEDAPHLNLLQAVQQQADSTIVQPHSDGPQAGANPTDAVLVLAPVLDTSEADDHRQVLAIVELLMRSGSSPAVQQGWRELLETVAAIAGEFHLRQQLRRLRDERKSHDDSLMLMRRLQQASGLQQLGYEIANEGRRYVGADRLTVIVRQAGKWKVLAASGVERVEPRADTTKQLQELAAATSDWGEPIEYSDASPEATADLPSELASLIARHADQAQTRRLVATPLGNASSSEERTSPVGKEAAVLIAEAFSTDEQAFSRQQVLELASLCEPAFRQAVARDRFPMRSCLRWADRWQYARETWGLSKLATAALAVALMIAALMFVQVDYEVEAPATLRPTVERDVFATTDGKVADVRIAHGEQVSAGDVLAVLDDPQLLLEVQRVEGEIATTRKRLEAIAVARTDRQVREETKSDELPLSAEAEQLEKQLASLQLQQQILTRRREALTLRSPIDGTVLTLDVQNLLRMRPVERGQVLFTVADTSAGWQLEAQVPQDRIGAVVSAQRQTDEQLPVRFRVAGETERTYRGRLGAISTTAVLDTQHLDQESPGFQATIQVDDESQLLARPGMNAQVRIDCGSRSLGYVWLHDIWQTVYSWLVF